MIYEKLASVLVATYALGISSLSLNNENMLDLTKNLENTHNKIISYENNEEFLLEKYNSLKTEAEEMINKANIIIQDKNQKIQDLENKILELNNIQINTDNIELEESDTEILNEENIDSEVNTQTGIDSQINNQTDINVEINSIEGTSIDNIENFDIDVN